VNHYTGVRVRRWYNLGVDRVGTLNMHTKYAGSLDGPLKMHLNDYSLPF
jgi:hypothetical protein